MGKIIQLTANLKPSNLLRRMRKHAEVSEGSKHRLVATRIVLGKRVDFYHNGLRKVHGLELDEQEIHDSEVLRFAHASILTGLPSGNKDLLYVDASVNPVEVWIEGMPFKKYMNMAKQAVQFGVVDPEFFIEQPLNKTKEFYRG